MAAQQIARGGAFAEEQVEHGETRRKGEAVGEHLVVGFVGGRAGEQGAVRCAVEGLEGAPQVTVSFGRDQVGVAEAERPGGAEQREQGVEQGRVEVGQEFVPLAEEGF